MSCFPCFSSNGNKKSKSFNARELNSRTPSQRETTPPAPPKPAENDAEALRRENKDSGKNGDAKGSPQNSGGGNINAINFTFCELAAATKNFRPDCLLGEGGFGRVYKGFTENNTKVVAVKQLHRNGLQGNSEFLVKVLMLSQLHHPNLVNLIGYCADGEQRLLVYEFMPLGSLEDHLLDLAPDRSPLNWSTRMKIATGTAQGLEYLHETANPAVMHQDLKSSNILLDEEYNPKLSDFGLAKLGPGSNKVQISSRVMGTNGYCAPEYARSGHLTLKSDVFSFGVILLEIITGRRAIDPLKPTDEQNLVTWAQPMIEQKNFADLVDPLFDGDYPIQGVKQAVAVAAMCLQEEPSVRPLMTDVVMALSFLSVEVPGATPPTSASQAPSFCSSGTEEGLQLGQAYTEQEIAAGRPNHV